MLFKDLCIPLSISTGELDPIAVVSLLCNNAEKLGKLQAMLKHKDKLQRTLLHYAAMRGAAICSSFFIKVSKPSLLLVLSIVIIAMNQGVRIVVKVTTY